MTPKRRVNAKSWLLLLKFVIFCISRCRKSKNKIINRDAAVKCFSVMGLFLRGMKQSSIISQNAEALRTETGFLPPKPFLLNP